MRLSIVLTSLLLGAAMLPAHAASYRVDVIVFEDVTAAAADGEAPVPQRLELQGALDRNDSARLAARGIEILPESSFGLAGELRSIRNSKRFEPLLSLAWIQRDPPASGGPLLRLRSDTSHPVTDPLSGQMADIATVDGWLRLDVSNLIRMHVDLQFAPPTAQPPVGLRLQQSQQLKKGELYHFDGGAVGLLVRIIDAETSATP